MPPLRVRRIHKLFVIKPATRRDRSGLHRARLPTLEHFPAPAADSANKHDNAYSPYALPWRTLPSPGPRLLRTRHALAFRCARGTSPASLNIDMDRLCYTVLFNYHWTAFFHLPPPAANSASLPRTLRALRLLACRTPVSFILFSTPPASTPFIYIWPASLPRTPTKTGSDQDPASPPPLQRCPYPTGSSAIVVTAVQP